MKPLTPKLARVIEPTDAPPTKRALAARWRTRCQEAEAYLARFAQEFGKIRSCRYCRRNALWIRLVVPGDPSRKPRNLAFDPTTLQRHGCHAQSRKKLPKTLRLPEPRTLDSSELETRRARQLELHRNRRGRFSR